MESAHRIWRALAGRLGKVERVLLLSAAAMIIAAPLAVAGPQESANLATTPTSTGGAPSTPPHIIAPAPARVPKALPQTGGGGTAS